MTQIGSAATDIISWSFEHYLFVSDFGFRASDFSSAFSSAARILPILH